jgi:hypothetical protein
VADEQEMKNLRQHAEMNPELTTELLIMPDGRILVHNLTRPFAELLHELNPDAEQIAARVQDPAGNAPQ